MKNVILSSVLLVILASSSSVLAGEHEIGMNHAAKHGMQHATTDVQVHKAAGTVNKIDFEHGKINLTHGPVKSLSWPGMTMDFNVNDNAILNSIKAGQEVEFEVVKEGSGQFYIDRIVPRQ